MFAVNNYLVINQSKSVFKNIKFYVVGKMVLHLLGVGVFEENWIFRGTFVKQFLLNAIFSVYPKLKSSHKHLATTTMNTTTTNEMKIIWTEWRC